MIGAARFLLVALAAAASVCACGADRGAPANGPAPLVLERAIPLPGIAGRIDHLAYDGQNRLFVAELGNGSVEAVDLDSEKSVGRIVGLKEPQGLAWLPDPGMLAIASGDGRLGFYDARLELIAAMKLGNDADDLLVDPKSGMLAVGFGSGAVALIDPKSRRVLREAKLPGHPEGFRLSGDRVFANVPDAGRIVAADMVSGRTIASWATGGLRMNFPMALDPESGLLAIGFRLPARLAFLDPATGAVRATMPSCGDADDLFVDAKRRRLYLVCGSGDVDIFAARNGNYAPMARIRTRPGARTGVFVAARDRLYVAARSEGGAGAAILVFRPTDSGR
jgi:hypothetical protein